MAVFPLFFPVSFRLAAVVVSSLSLLSACSNGDAPDAAAVTPSSSLTAAQLGALIFHDPSLSASGKQSCASCHSPAHAHAAPNVLAVQLGGPQLDQPGTRAVPSLRYLAATPAFGFDDEGTASGGFNHDGGADTLAAQAERPLLAANEMANLTRKAVIEKLRRAKYADDFRRVYGERSLDDVDTAFAGLTQALERYQLDAAEFQPFDSKYDAWLAGKAELSAAEQRGRDLFNDAKKGNCAACHPSERSDDGRPPLFTDFTYDALGVPRNTAITANADPAYHDLGLCRSGRPGPAAADSECGKFKVPTLRNVGTRQVFFHNGQIRSLRDAVAFYVRRDTHPHEWYTRSKTGAVVWADDLPPAMRGNVNRDEAPYDRKPGQQPRLSESEIDDVVSFLHTLTDGYKAAP